MLGQFSYRGGKDLDTGQKTVSPLRAFPFSFFFSPLFFFFFFFAARLRMHSGLCHFVFVFRANSRPRFSLRCALPQTALLKSALLPLSTATRRRSSPSCLFELRFPSLLRHSSSRWFDHILRKMERLVVFAEGNEESLERSQTGKRSILAKLLCLTSDA